MEVDDVDPLLGIGDLLPVLRLGRIPIGVNESDPRSIALAVLCIRCATSPLERRPSADRHLDYVVEDRMEFR